MDRVVYSSLYGQSPWGPWGRKESDTTERLDFHFHLAEIVKAGKSA